MTDKEGLMALVDSKSEVDPMKLDVETIVEISSDDKTDDDP